MAVYGGFRKVLVIEDATEGRIDKHGAYLLIEVTNNSGSEVKFYPNEEYVGQGSHGIPIAPNATRQIPLAVYTFRATGNVTVVAYGQ
jgi:hypothetical protein